MPQYQPRFYPFDGGESAEYRASWNGIPVASAEIQSAPLFIDGKKFYQVKVRARTWRYLELIWKMRDVIESTFEAKTLHPIRFIFRERENRKKIDTTAYFDPASKKWVVHRQQGYNIKDYEFISQHTLDPISAVYLARSLDFKVGDTLRMEVFGGNSRYLVLMDILGMEPVSTRAGLFEAYRIVPRVMNLTSSGYAGRVRQATVWDLCGRKETTPQGGESSIYRLHKHRSGRRQKLNRGGGQQTPKEINFQRFDTIRHNLTSG